MSILSFLLQSEQNQSLLAHLKPKTRLILFFGNRLILTALIAPIFSQKQS